MTLGDRTSIRRHGMAAVVGYLAHSARGGQSGAGMRAGSWRPGRGSGSIPGGDHGASRHDADVDGRHQRQRRRCPAHGPRFSVGQGCLHHDRSPRCRGRNRGLRNQQPRPDRGRVHRCRRDDLRLSAGRWCFYPDRSPGRRLGTRGRNPGPWPQRPGSGRGRVRRC